MLRLGDRNIARRPDVESEELEPWQEAGETKGGSLLANRMAIPCLTAGRIH